MAPGASMYLGLLGSKAAEEMGLHPFPYPAAVNSTVYDGRPPCNDCGWCSGFGCSTGAKGSSAVTGIRKALLSGNALLLPETKVTKLLKQNRQIVGVEAIDPDGEKVKYSADRYILAASPIEDVRLLLLSDSKGRGLGNSSGQMGRNLTFHYETFAIGIFEQRTHAHRGKSVTHGFLDFRGSPSDKSRPMGGIVEICGEGGVIDEAINYVSRIGIKGKFLKKLMVESPLRDHMMALIMHGEDAPQYSNYVDLDPQIKDFDGIPAPRITYRNHDFELTAQKFYGPKMLELFQRAGAKYGFIAPNDQVMSTKHIMGTLRFGQNPRTSVCDASGRFHDIDNLFAADGALFPTSSGINPTLTIAALAAWVAGSIVVPGNPAKALI
jgi:choline dehydrogenase-like flavoprotein